MIKDHLFTKLTSAADYETVQAARVRREITARKTADDLRAAVAAQIEFILNDTDVTRGCFWCAGRTVPVDMLTADDQTAIVDTLREHGYAAELFNAQIKVTCNCADVERDLLAGTYKGAMYDGGGRDGGSGDGNKK